MRHFPELRLFHSWGFKMWLIGKPIKRIARVRASHGSAEELKHPDVVHLDCNATHLLGRDILGHVVLFVPLSDVSVAVIEKVPDAN